MAAPPFYEVPHSAQAFADLVATHVVKSIREELQALSCQQFTPSHEADTLSSLHSPPPMQVEANKMTVVQRSSSGRSTLLSLPGQSFSACKSAPSQARSNNGGTQSEPLSGSNSRSDSEPSQLRPKKSILVQAAAEKNVRASCLAIDADAILGGGHGRKESVAGFHYQTFTASKEDETATGKRKVRAAVYRQARASIIQRPRDSVSSRQSRQSVHSSRSQTVCSRQSRQSNSSSIKSKQSMISNRSVCFSSQSSSLSKMSSGGRTDFQRASSGRGGFQPVLMPTPDGICSLPSMSEDEEDPSKEESSEYQIAPMNSNREFLANAWNMDFTDYDEPKSGCLRIRQWAKGHCSVLGHALLTRNASDIVEMAAFDYLCAMIIIMNAIFLGMQTDYISRNLDTDTPSYFRISEIAFCVIFTLELTLRIIAYRSDLFYMPSWKWNVFDCFLVVMQVSEEVLAVVAQLSEQEDGQDTTSNFGALRVLRVLRLVRIIRLVRVMHLIGELRILVVSIFNSLRSLLWTLLLLFIIMYIVGVYFCQVVSDHLMANGDDVQRVPELQDYYGSLPRAVTSLFQAIAGGISWRLIVRPLQENISPWLVLPVCAYVAFAVLALLNIITGVFVENSMKSAKKDDDMLLLTQSRHLFLDHCNDDGEISWETFQDSLENPMMQNYFRAVDLSIDEAQLLFTLIDIDESGSLTPDEFVNGCLRLRGNSRALDLAVLMRELARTKVQLTAMGAAIVWITEQMDPEGASREEIATELEQSAQKSDSLLSQHMSGKSSHDQKPALSLSKEESKPESPTSPMTCSQRHQRLTPDVTRDVSQTLQEEDEPEEDDPDSPTSPQIKCSQSSEGWDFTPPKGL